MSRSLGWLTLLLCGLTATASAQQAPLGQAQGARHGGEVSPVGAAHPSAPIDLPPERHGLPLPLTLVETGGHIVKEAGLGWSVPLSYVEVNSSNARRRPRFLISGAPWTGPTPSALPNVTVSLSGARTMFVKVDEAGHYRSVVDGQNAQLTDRTAQNNTWELLDGHGRKYVFSALANADASHWFLTQILDGTGDHVDLKYNAVRVTDLGKAPQTAPAIEIQLGSILYDFDTAGCPKHSVALSWGTPLGTSGPLALSVEAGALWVRTQVINAITVSAHGATCGTAWRALSRYALRYAPDVDKPSLPRLVKLDLLGADGTPEATRALPVGRYWYGNTTKNHGVEAPPGTGPYFVRGPDLAMPSGAALGLYVPIAPIPWFPFVGITFATFEDYDGDGLPDLVTNGAWFRNRRGAGFVAAGDPLANITIHKPAYIGVHQASAELHGGSYAISTQHEEMTTQMIDFNGDGRMDIVSSIDAAPGHWWLYLNGPTSWTTIDLDVSDVRNALMTTGHEFPNSLNLSPSRSTTGTTYDQWHCVTPDGYACPSSFLPMTHYLELQRTRVDWKLADVNGDGYPDLVVSRYPSREVPTPKSCIGQAPSYGDYYQAACTGSVRFDVSVNGKLTNVNELWVFYNRAGTQLSYDGLKPFSSWTKLQTDTTCSVEEFSNFGAFTDDAHGWVENGVRFYGAVGAGADSGSVQRCGLLDVNGDGILDRFDGSVRLGTGSSFGADVTAGYVSDLRRTTSPSWDRCHPDQGGTFDVVQDAGYLDMNGDALPDYVDARSRTVRYNSGVGLGEAMPLLGAPADFGLSWSKEQCNGTSTTNGGLFDVDGDGKPEYVRAQSTLLQTWSLANGTSGRGAADAGRLIEARNGSGGVQHYHYGNAKLHYAPTQTGDDSAHQVPFPELVVDSTWMTDSTGGNVPIAPTSFAYGGARMWFDAIGDRWVFVGYERSATVTGVPSTTPGMVFGSGRVVETYRPADLASVTEQNLFVGRPKREGRLRGTLPQDARALLDPAQSIDSLAGWSGQSDLTYQFVAQQLSGYHAADDCLAIGQPLTSGQQGSMLTSGGLYGDYDPRCFSTAATSPRTTTTRSGTSVSTGAYVETRTIIGTLDPYGRALSVEYDGDTNRVDDDLCESISFATADPAWNALDAISTVRWLVPLADAKAGGTRCDGATQVLSGERRLYDGFTEGVVSAGTYSGRIVERYDPTLGKKLDEYTVEKLFYVPGSMAVLQKAMFDIDAANNKWRVYEPSGWDPWSLRHTATAISSTDQPTVLTTTRSFDPYSLVVVEARDENGKIVRHRYDGFGRVVQDSFVDPANGVEYLATATQYLPGVGHTARMVLSTRAARSSFRSR